VYGPHPDRELVKQEFLTRRRRGAEKDEKRFFRKTWRGISHVEMPREVFTIKNSVTSVSFVVGLKG
jgi:hypothetical protein